jgi:tRNA(Ile)-lysidine synthase
MRGSGPAGLAGIGLQQSFGRGLLLRPLLGVSREAIEDYAALHQLDWIEDPSNEDSRFDRNFLRNEIMPTLASRWPAVSNRLRRSAELVGEASALLNDLADMDLATLGEANRLRIDVLKELTTARQQNVLRRAVRLCGLPPLPSTRTYQIINELLPARVDAQPLVAWTGGCVRRYRDHLYVMAWAPPDADDPAGCLRPDKPALRLGPGLGELALTAGRSVGIDPALADSGLVIRFRDGGETIRVDENGPTKKLKKLLQEEGIVPWMRGSLPLLFAGEKLVAVADLWVAADVAVRPGVNVIWTDRPALK